MAGDRQEDVAHLTVKGIAEEAPTNLEEPGRQGGQECVEPCEQEVLGAGALLDDDGLQDRDDQAGGHRNEDRGQAGARTGAFRCYEDPAWLHTSSTSDDDVTGTSEV